MINTNKVKRGDYWSNVDANTGLFKNYGVEVRQNVSRKTRIKFIFRAVFCHPKPGMGYKKFFQTWHTPCGVVRRLDQLLQEIGQTSSVKREMEPSTPFAIPSCSSALSTKGSSLYKDSKPDTLQIATCFPEGTEGKCPTSTRAKDLICWLGHASQLLCLVEGNVNILFDPIFSTRASPFRFLGPKRKYPPPLQVKNLPPIDLVLISHNHYDHLDQDSIVLLYKHFPWVQFIVPLKMETLLVPWGIPSSRIISLNWWEEVEIHRQRPWTSFHADSVQSDHSLPSDHTLYGHSREDNHGKVNTGDHNYRGNPHSVHLRIAATPAQHYGLHWTNDYNKVLWCGWCLGWKASSSHSPPPLASLGELLPISSPISPEYHTVEMRVKNENNETEIVKTLDMDSSSGRSKSCESSGCASHLSHIKQREWSWNSADLKTYFFTGDTAFNPEIFEQIHFHYPRISMAGLPIGAYSPREMLKYAHIDPESAVEIFEIMHIQRSYGLHWGTFELGGEPLDEPPEVLRKALAAKSLAFGGLEQGGDGQRVFHAIPTGSFLEF